MAYDLENEVLILDGRECKIESFRVGFATPFGVFANLKDARNQCADLGNHTLIIQPVVMIYDEAGRSEIFIRH